MDRAWREVIDEGSAADPTQIVADNDEESKIKERAEEALEEAEQWA